METMQHWSWDNYVMLLGLKGHDVRERRDSKRVLHNYTLRKGNVIIKASELRGRAFMVSRLEDTWRKLHEQKAEVTVKSKVERTSTATNTDDSRTTTHQPQPSRSSRTTQSHRFRIHLRRELLQARHIRPHHRQNRITRHL